MTVIATTKLSLRLISTSLMAVNSIVSTTISRRLRNNSNNMHMGINKQHRDDGFDVFCLRGTPEKEYAAEPFFKWMTLMITTYVVIFLT